MRTLRSWLWRFGGLFHKQQRDSELAAEIDSHLQMHIADSVRSGLTLEEARRRAVLSLGGIDQAKENYRDRRSFPALEALIHDMSFGLRMLRKSPGFTIVVVLTLALGIGANTAMFSIVSAWLLRPLPLKNPQELVSVWRTRSQDPRQPAYFNLYHDYLLWSSQNRTFRSLAATFLYEYALTGAGEPKQVHGAVASWNFFQTVGATPYLGRLFEAADVRREPACVISHALWTGQFHSAPDVVGQPIELNRNLCLVIGVLPESFSFRVLDRPFEIAVWTVITASEARYNSAAPSPVAVIGRLGNGVTRAQAEADLSALQAELNRQFSDEPKDSGIFVANLQQDNTRTVRISLWLLFGAVGVLLIIACVNAGSLIVGRNLQRSKEFAVRLALGCETRRLLQQLTTEILTVFVFGGMVGLLVAFGLLRVFTVWSPFGVLPPGGISLDATVLTASAAIVCVTALVFGSLPAFRGLNVREQDVLGSSGSQSTSLQGRLRYRALLVAMEIALSVVLLVGAGLLISTFVRIDSEPLGFQTRNVFVEDVALPHRIYPTNAGRARFCKELLQRLRVVPGVQAAGTALSWPFNVDGLTPLETDEQQGLPLDHLPSAATLEVSPGYFDALGIPLLQGRTFNESEGADSRPVAVINDAMAHKYFSGEDPIGKHIRLRYIDRASLEPWLTIVGVVSDTSSVRYNHVQWDRYPAVYTSFFQHSAEFASNIADTKIVYVYLQDTFPIDASTIASAVHGIDPNLAVGTLQTTNQIVSALHSQPRARAILIGGFGLWALQLAAIGVAGVMGQMIEQQRHDIGIRMAIGAQPGDVMLFVLRQGAGLTLIGLLLGLPAAWGAARLMTAFLYGANATDTLTFLGVASLLMAVALVSCYIPTRKAIRIDPALALRHE